MKTESRTEFEFLDRVGLQINTTLDAYPLSLSFCKVLLLQRIAFIIFNCPSIPYLLFKCIKRSIKVICRKKRGLDDCIVNIVVVNATGLHSAGIREGNSYILAQFDDI